MRYFITALSLFAFVLSGCKKDPVSPPGSTDTTIVHAVYILNEGSFAGHGSLTVYDYDRGTVHTDAYEAANGGAHLGSIGDDMKIAGGKLYVLASGSNEIHVLRLSDLNDIMSRSFTSGAFDSTLHDICVDTVHHKVFVTRLGAAQVRVLTDDSLKSITDIPVGQSPQGMLVVGNDLYVCNSGYGFDSTISVINIATNTVVKTITVAPGPSSIAAASDGSLAVACTGDTVRGGAVYIINPSTRTIVKHIQVSGILYGGIACDNSGHAFVNAASGYDPDVVHRINIAAGTVTTSFYSGIEVYAMAYNPYTNELFFSDVLHYTQSGRVYIVGLDGSLKKSFTAQLIPGTFAFRWN